MSITTNKEKFRKQIVDAFSDLIGSADYAAVVDTDSKNDKLCGLMDKFMRTILSAARKGLETLEHMGLTPEQIDHDMKAFIDSSVSLLVDQTNLIFESHDIRLRFAVKDVSDAQAWALNVEVLR